MKSRKLKILLPLITMGIVTLTHVAYADVKVNIKEDKTEGYSYNSNETVNINVPEPSKAPLASDINEYKGSDDDLYKSNIDNDYYDSEVDADDYYENYSYDDSEDYNRDNYDEEDVDEKYYNSYKENEVIDIEDDDVPTVDSYDEDSEKGMKDNVLYADEHYSRKLKKGTKYEIISKDMVVQKNTVIDKKSKIRYATLPEGSSVEVVGFTTQNGKKLVELMTDTNKVYYEDIENFYNNSIEKDASDFSRYMKGLINDASMRGTEKGYNTCVAIAILFMLGTIFFVNFLDSNVLRLKDDGEMPYINSIARVMPGAMIGSFLIIANMFDKNAVDYYLYEGFNLLGENYELIHWLMQLILIVTIFMLGRLVVEGVKCFTLPCMIIRTLILLAANIASFYLCFGLSYVGVAIYVLLILYQCICVNSYECPDIGDESEGEGDCEEGDGEGECDEEGGDEGEPEPEPEAL